MKYSKLLRSKLLFEKFSPKQLYGKSIKDKRGGKDNIHSWDLGLKGEVSLAQKIISETNSKSEIVYLPYEQAYGDGFEDMERRVPNIELINELVGWKPKRDLSTIIADISAEMKKRS